MRPFDSRLRCVSITPLGRPVVPEVYCSSAMSCAVGRRYAGSIRSLLSSCDHGTVPGAGPVSFSREARALLTGSFSAVRMRRGIAEIRFTE